MVYRGKPSPACEPCRSRRLKCDQQRPSCSQCIRAKRECHGYRDLDRLAIHDQSAEVADKARRRGKRTESTSPERTLSNNGHRQLRPSPRASPSLAINDQAASFIFAHYVQHSQHARGHLDFLPVLMKGSPSPAITASLSAMGLASLANIHMSPALLQAARKEYSVALTATSAALQDPVGARSDSTLAAVELLSLYEIATCQGPPLIGRWLNHIEGGIKLIEIRGAEQLCRPAGLELFTQLRLQIALGNVYKKVSTPSWLVDLSQLAVAYRGDTGDQVLDYFFRILVRLGNVIAMIKDNRFNDPALMLEQAIRLDAELVSWAMSVDRSWHYTVVKVHKADTEDDTYRYVYGDHYHIYPNSIVSMAWNNYRFTRIIIHGIIEYIYDVSAHSDEKVAAYKTTAMQSADLTRQLAEDICAGVPYHLGITGSADPMTLGIPFAGGVLRLMWPLFIASDCSGSSNRMRAWIATCLEKIGHGVGINMALTMAQILRDNMHLNWRNEGEPNIVKRPRRPYLVRNEA